MKDNKENRSILFLIQLPPPLHGVGLINKFVWEDKNLWQGWDVDLLELRFSKKTSQLRRQGLFKVIRFLSIWIRLFWKCLIHRYQYVYFSIIPVSLGFYRDICYVALIKAFRIKPIYHIHLSGIKNASNRRLIRFLYKWAFSNSIIIHPSGRVSRSEFDKLVLRNTQIYIQPNGINGVERVERTGFPKRGNGLHIIHLSHLYKFKGLEILLDVFYDLAKDGHNIYLDIIGDKAERSVYKKMLEYLDHPVTKGRIKWHGLLTGRSKLEILEKADIMAYTSMKDIFPLVILEAMRSGLPLIASDVGAIPEILQDQKSGLLFEAGNRAQLRENLELLITNQDLRKSIAEQAITRYKAKYTGYHFQRGMQKIIKKL